MAEMSNTLKARLARSAEAKLRYEGSEKQGGLGWQAMGSWALGNWLFKQQPAGGPYTFGQYRTIATNVIRNARDAATMMQNPEMTILNLGRSPGIPAEYPAFEYRTVIVGYDQNNKEVWDRLVYTYSSTELSFSQVEADALSQVVAPLLPPGFPTYPEGRPTEAVTIKAFIVSAGKK